MQALKPSDLVTISCPVAYKTLISDLIDWLMDDFDPSEFEGGRFTKNYKLLRYLINNSDGGSIEFNQDVLYPPVFFKYGDKPALPLTRLFLQRCIDKYPFIYNPFSLFEFLINFPCFGLKGGVIDYNLVYRWRSLNFGDKAQITKPDAHKSSRYKKAILSKEMICFFAQPDCRKHLYSVLSSSQNDNYLP
jgi:hypothetical protein